MIILVMTVQDVDRDYAHVDLSSFDALTIEEWVQFFLTEREGWEEQPRRLHTYFEVEGQSYRVECTFYVAPVVANFARAITLFGNI